MWAYNNGVWEAYSSDENRSNLIKQKYTFFTKTKPYQGFWVYVDKSTGGNTNTTPSANKKTISGYVVDDPVVGATIEVYDENGTFVKKVSNITDQDGKYSIEIKGDSSSLPVLLKVTGGEIKSKKFESSMWSICFDEQCNVTPITSIVALSFATDISNTSKEQLSKYAQEQLGIDNWQSLIIT